MFLLAGCGAARAPSPEPPRLLVAADATADVAGAWSGPAWGRVVLNRDGTGRYADTYGTGPGRIAFHATGDGYEGRWWESERRFGTLRFALAPDGRTIRGAWAPDPACTIGTAEGGALQWTRADDER